MDIDFSSGLNSRQEEAVRHPGGPLLVLAGAGSGKTRVLTHRVAWLIRERGVPAEGILAFTFTNKAAAEMRGRIEAMVGRLKGLWVGTFHSTGVRILRRYGERVGIPSNFSIYDDDDQMSLVRQILRDEGTLASKELTPRQVLSRISDAKEAGVTPPDFEKHVRSPLDQRVRRVYGAYEAALARAGALDFDDLIMRTLQLLREHLDVQEGLSRRFMHVLVDEYQDTSPAQVDLVSRLASVHRNLMVVGDDDQSIYGWRGADPTNILKFEKAFPDAHVVRLEQNYRSTQTILEAANAVIRRNTSRKGKELWTENPVGTPIEWFEAHDEEEEAARVESRLGQMAVGGLTRGDCAVLYRTNAQSRALEGAFRHAGVPYQLVGGVAFYQRKEIKDLLAYLRLLIHPEDDLAFRRIANVPTRGLGDAFLSSLDADARERGVPLRTALEAWMREGRLEGARNAGARGLVETFAALDPLRDEGIEVLAAELVERTRYRDYLLKSDPESSEDRLANVEEFIAGAAAFSVRAEDSGLEAFLAEAALIADVDRMTDDSERVTLMTAHAAKGLEFPVVCIVGLEEGLFPHSNSLLKEEKVEEERRLFYVALTRAEQRIVLSGTRYRRRYDLAGPARPSRFLDEIPGKLLRGRTAEGPMAGGAAVRRAAPTVATAPLAAEAGSGSNWVGRTLLHATFGPGRVVEQEGKGSQAKLTVEFAGGVRRKILARYAEESF